MPVRPDDAVVGCQSGMKAFSSFSVCDVKADRHQRVAAAMQSRANPQKFGFLRHAGRFARELFGVALISIVCPSQKPNTRVITGAAKPRQPISSPNARSVPHRSQPYRRANPSRCSWGSGLLNSRYRCSERISSGFRRVSRRTFTSGCSQNRA